ncbi:Hypothetical predicted protein [Podarcis lilfordi]|uniref:Uncharacterized protein n=1 Tax=Podarcis lilfordi TaxID=74358 RepID=A0AA35JXW3_9SAUR|nr:Hypothetical predicted protein [Podarcis lilfordi]
MPWSGLQETPRLLLTPPQHSRLPAAFVRVRPKPRQLSILAPADLRGRWAGFSSEEGRREDGEEAVGGGGVISLFSRDPLRGKAVALLQEQHHRRRFFHPGLGWRWVILLQLRKEKH